MVWDDIRSTSFTKESGGTWHVCKKLQGWGIPDGLQTLAAFRPANLDHKAVQQRGYYW